MVKIQMRCLHCREQKTSDVKLPNAEVFGTVVSKVVQLTKMRCTHCRGPIKGRIEAATARAQDMMGERVRNIYPEGHDA